jgi:hypothetical protein
VSITCCALQSSLSRSLCCPQHAPLPPPPPHTHTRMPRTWPWQRLALAGHQHKHREQQVAGGRAPVEGQQHRQDDAGEPKPCGRCRGNKAVSACASVAACGACSGPDEASCAMHHTHVCQYHCTGPGVWDALSACLRPSVPSSPSSPSKVLPHLSPRSPPRPTRPHPTSKEGPALLHRRQPVGQLGTLPGPLVVEAVVGVQPGQQDHVEQAAWPQQGGAQQGRGGGGRQ